MFGRHLDSRPFGLGGKVFYPLRLKFYSEQFKRDAVALYENNEALSLAAAAAELGVNRASLHQWKKEFDTSKKTRTTVAKAQAESVSDAERIRALEKENGPDPRKVDTVVLIKKHV
ncbi:transposase [Corynebacterium casei]|uniref:transposase n=1 Tax=Corynebacterium casei TaxID=160386 RepID=UPI003FD4FDA7